MRTVKYQYVTRIRNAQGRLETIEENTFYAYDTEPGEKLYRMHSKAKVEVRKNHANTFLERKDDNGLVNRRIAFDNSRRCQLSDETIEYDEQGKLVHSLIKGDEFRSETAAIHADGINITHEVKLEAGLFHENEYVVLVDDGTNYVEATYSLDTGRLMRIVQAFPDTDTFTTIDFFEDGTIHEFRKECFFE